MRLQDQMRRIVLALVAVAACSVSHAQDFKESIRKMRDEYKNSDQLHIVMDISAYDSGSMKSPFYHERAIIKRDKDNYSYKFGTNDMLINSRYLIVVDKNAKEISCKKLPKNKDEMPDFNVNIDSILNFYEQPKYVGNNDGVDHYLLTQRKGQIRDIEMFINTNTNLLQRMLYSYVNSQKVSIEFEVFDTKPQFDRLAFDEKNYVTEVKGKLQPSDAFRTYTVSLNED